MFPLVEPDIIEATSDRIRMYFQNTPVSILSSRTVSVAGDRFEQKGLRKRTMDNQTVSKHRCAVEGYSFYEQRDSLSTAFVLPFS